MLIFQYVGVEIEYFECQISVSDAHLILIFHV